MKPIVVTYRLGDTQISFTMPLAMTDRTRSANGHSVTPLHRLADDALEFVNHIVESLELDGGLVTGEVYPRIPFCFK